MPSAGSWTRARICPALCPGSWRNWSWTCSWCPAGTHRMYSLLHLCWVIVCNISLPLARMYSGLFTLYLRNVQVSYICNCLITYHNWKLNYIKSAISASKRTCPAGLDFIPGESVTLSPGICSRWAQTTINSLHYTFLISSEFIFTVTPEYLKFLTCLIVTLSSVKFWSVLRILFNLSGMK